MTLRVAVVTPGKVKAIIEAVRAADGEYLAVQTNDPDGCLEAAGLGGLRHMAGPEYLNSPAVLIAVVTPGDKNPHRTCSEVSVGAAFKAIGHALVNTPEPPPDVQRFRPWNKSYGWGDKLIKEPSDIKVRCPVKFTHPDTEKILTELRALVPFWFGDRTIQGKPLGIGGSPAQSVCLSFLLGGIGATTPPTIDKVIQLGREWLKAIPREIGSGPRVQAVIREHLWFGPLGRMDEVREQLLRADEIDRREAEFAAEAESILRAIRDAYRGREHEARGIYAVALGLDPGPAA